MVDYMATWQHYWNASMIEEWQGLSHNGQLNNYCVEWLQETVGAQLSQV